MVSQPRASCILDKHSTNWTCTQLSRHAFVYHSKIPVPTQLQRLTKSGANYLQEGWLFFKVTQIVRGLGSMPTAVVQFAVPYTSPQLMETAGCPYLWVSKLITVSTWEMGKGWIQMVMFLEASRRHLEATAPMNTPVKLALHESHKTTLVVRTSSLSCPVHWVGLFETRTIHVGNETTLKLSHLSPDAECG